MFQYSDNILFSTETIPKYSIEKASDWWYFVPEIGQHISFYTIESLEYIARKFTYKFYSNGTNLHLFTKKTFKRNPLELPNRDKFLLRKLKKLVKKLDPNVLKSKKSLLDHDWHLIRDRIRG
jgi:hypothetical protein